MVISHWQSGVLAYMFGILGLRAQAESIVVSLLTGSDKLFHGRDLLGTRVRMIRWNHVTRPLPGCDRCRRKIHYIPAPW